MFIHLGMTTSDFENLNFRYVSNPMDIILMGLFDWRDKTESDKAMASFEDLQKALSAIKRQHYLCQVRLGLFFLLLFAFVNLNICL